MMFRRVVSLLSLLIAASVVSATQSPVSDAEALQQTLAKIVFAHDVAVINDLSSKTVNRETPAQLQQALADENLPLSLTDVSTGSVSSIIHRNLVDLVTWLPNNRTLDVTTAVVHVTNEAKPVGDERQAQIHWGGGNSTQSPIAATHTLQDAINVSPKAESCARYVTGKVTASYKGETAQWRPLYLLGCTDDAVVALDLVMGNAVPNFWNAEVYPHTLLKEGGIRGRVPAAQEWLNAHASATCTATQPCCFENGSIVIPKAKIPAPYQTTTQGSVAPPLNQGLGCSAYGFSRNATPTTPRSNEDHVTQYHEFDGTAIESCNYWGVNGDASPCNVDANVSPTAVEVENGVTRYYIHYKDQAIQGGDDTVGSHVTANAQGVAAGDFRFCIIFPCGTQIGIQGYSVTFSSAGHWDNQLNASVTCPPENGGSGGSPLTSDRLDTKWSSKQNVEAPKA